ncbi:Cytochrome b5-like Heme/Steroid binding domain protein [Clostridium liquoris]|jgi:predicted heme/steroid binding protein|uniref:Cytochrome b5-like Heme/Steroid binding domain protein n=1 Tax=Clostridium liquoris TaxID=1289519 RepID=A0A2T0B3S7_9CLOT|nr:cytochrome b5 domain-containing protein [Clostridium liquoris]PRR78526.1 Cytochrome b5-like Heme/Steroid binding domain protein [Clostridium liquoris]
METYSNSEKLKEIKEKVNRNCYYRKSMRYTSCPIQIAYYENLLYTDMMNALKSITEIYRHIDKENIKINSRQTKEFTLEELSNYDGTMGKPAYVAVNGRVYDVSNEATWGGASHFGLIAGKDLTSQFNGCHGNLGILSNLPKVGILKP